MLHFKIKSKLSTLHIRKHLVSRDAQFETIFLTFIASCRNDAQSIQRHAEPKPFD